MKIILLLYAEWLYPLLKDVATIATKYYLKERFRWASLR
jgi:hypothetical protein